MTPADHAEYQAYLDAQEAQRDQDAGLMRVANFLGAQIGKLNALVSRQSMPDEATDHGPDPLHDGEAYSQEEYERDVRDAQGGEPVARDASGDEVGEHVGWPGDGSGLDDLADMHNDPNQI
jgi:hypothetical protein